VLQAGLHVAAALPASGEREDEQAARATLARMGKRIRSSFIGVLRHSLKLG
jgi:hypothetical protein